jgi:hypothetical protein
MDHLNLPDAYPELILAHERQLRRERELLAARRRARRDRLRSWLRRGYAAGEEVR